MYQKEIVYLNLFENDIKSGCVGYLKLENMQGNYSVELQVKNISNMFTGNFPIRFQGENDWKEADMLSIKDGCGIWSGAMTEPIQRAEILLSDSHRIKGESKKAQVSEIAANTYEEITNYAQTIKEQGQSDNYAPTHTEQKRSDNYSPTHAEQKESDNYAQTLAEQKESDIEISRSVPANITSVSESSDSKHLNTTSTIIKAEKISEQHNISSSEDKPKPKYNPETTPLYESKWDQLLNTYEQIHPYGDNRIYVKLEPKDFIVLRSNYQHLVNNSFLLHGFYNYRYLILGKEKDFYLGVPGVFYEREKMVALMFGFEAFECEGGDAEEGKFGYYLRKVEI